MGPNQMSATAPSASQEVALLCLPVHARGCRIYQKFYCLRQGTSKRGRESANQSVRQVVSLAVSQADRQADDTVWLSFSCGLRLQTSGNHLYAGTRSGRVVEHPANGLLSCFDSRPVVRRLLAQPIDQVRARIMLDPGSNPSNHKLLTHPPAPPPPPSSFRGIEVSKSKSPLGVCFVGQNNDFTRDWTSNIMPWGMLCE